MSLEILTELFSDYTIQVVLVGSFILGVTAGCLGCFAVLRQQSLLGDAIAHATLPGVGLAYWFTLSKSPLVLLLGAGISGWLGTLLVKVTTDYTRIKKDAALGIVLSVFFGFGLVVITIVQKLPSSTKAGLDTFLFGSAATLLKGDVQMMAVMSLLVLTLVLLFWKEFKIIVFDHDFAVSLGLRTHVLDILLTALIVMAIVIGLQAVGVVLMSAMLVAPAASARQWTDRLSLMALLSAMIGGVCGVLGALTSSVVPKLPTGPTIVVYLSFFVFISLIFAPNRGIYWDWLRARRHRRQIQLTSLLKNLMLFSEIQTDPFHAHDIAALDAIGRGTVDKRMQELESRGWAKHFPDKRWALTPKGLAQAKRLTAAYERGLPAGEDQA